MVAKKSGKLVSRSAKTRASNVKKATGKVRAKTSINFARSVRGK